MPLAAESPNVFLRIARVKRLFEDKDLESLSSSNGQGSVYAERVAIAQGLITTEDYLKTLENYFFNPAIDINHVDPDPAALLALSQKVAAKARALPLAKGSLST